MRIFVVDVTALALTLEATWRVHASAMGAHGRHQGAFVDLLGVIRDRIHDLTRYQSAQNLVFTSPLAGTFLAKNTPCGSHGAATQHFCLRLHHGIETTTRIVGEIARLLPHIDAFLSSRHRHVSLGTFAMIFSLIVDAVSNTTYSWM